MKPNIKQYLEDFLCELDTETEVLHLCDTLTGQDVSINLEELEMVVATVRRIRPDFLRD